MHFYQGTGTLLALITPALIPPRANFDLPPFRTAFNATIGKNQKKARFLIYNNNYFVFNAFFFPSNKVFDDKVPSVVDFTLIFIRRKCFKLYRRSKLTKCANFDTKISVLVKN